MFNRRGSFEEELEHSLTEKLAPFLDLSETGRTLEDLNQVATKFDQLGMTTAAEEATQLIEKIASPEEAGLDTTGKALHHLKKALVEIKAVPHDPNNQIISNRLRQIAEMVEKSYLYLDGLGSWEEESRSKQYEEEEGPPTLRNPPASDTFDSGAGPDTQRSAEQYWQSELTKTATPKYWFETSPKPATTDAKHYTVKFPPGAVKDIITDALQFAGVTNANYRYSSDGSTVKFSPKALNYFLRHLQDALQTDYMKEDHGRIKELLDHTKNAIKQDPHIAQASLDKTAKSKKKTKSEKPKKKSKPSKTTKTKATKPKKTKKPKTKTTGIDDLFENLTPEEELRNLEEIGWVFPKPADTFLAEDCNGCGEEFPMMMADDVNWAKEQAPVNKLRRQVRKYKHHPVDFSEINWETGEIEELDPEFDEIGFVPEIKHEADDFNWVSDCDQNMCGEYPELGMISKEDRELADDMNWARSRKYRKEKDSDSSIKLEPFYEHVWNPTKEERERLGYKGDPISLLPTHEERMNLIYEKAKQTEKRNWEEFYDQERQRKERLEWDKNKDDDVNWMEEDPVLTHKICRICGFDHLEDRERAEQEHAILHGVKLHPSRPIDYEKPSLDDLDDTLEEPQDWIDELDTDDHNWLNARNLDHGTT